MSRLRNAALSWHILFLILLSGIPGLAILAYGAWLEEHHLRTMAAEASTAAVRHVVAEQRKLLARTEQLLQRLSGMPEFSKSDFEACRRQLSTLLQFTHAYASFGIAGADGDVLCSPTAQDLRRNVADAEYFREVVKTGGRFFGGYQLDRPAGKASFPIATPVFHGPRLAGVAYAIVPADIYDLIGGESQIPRGFTMTVVDRNLRVLARVPRDGWLGKSLSEHPLGAVLRAVRSEGTGDIDGLESEPGARAHFAALAPLPGPNEQTVGFVVVSAPKTAVFAESRSALVRNLGAMLVVIVSVILIAVWGADRLVLRHVRNLVEANRKLKAGDTTARVGDPGGSQEIRDLGRIFNETALALHEWQTAVAETQRLARVGSWRWTPEADTTGWSEELYRMHGIDPKLPPLTFDEVRRRYVAESGERLTEAMAAALREGTPFELDLELTSGKWITARGKAVRDANGRVVEIRGTVQDITERKEIETALLENNHELVSMVEQLQSAKEQTNHAEKSALDYAERLRAMSRRIIEVQESDQRSFARELHDSVSSSLAVIGLELHNIAEELPKKPLSEIATKLNDCIELVKATMENARDISSDLHSAMLDHAGLALALEDMGGKYSSRANLPVTVTTTGPRRRAPAKIELALFRIAQEALTNCVKHARAAGARVELSFGEDGLGLSISDDGVGFDTARLMCEESRLGLGLLSMRERAEAIGGELLVRSAPASGTTIIVRAPCPSTTETPHDYVI